MKKSARWVPKLLSEEQKQERVRFNEFVAAVKWRSEAMLDNIVTMDEMMVSYHTPEAKKQCKQWVRQRREADGHRVFGLKGLDLYHHHR